MNDRALLKEVPPHAADAPLHLAVVGAGPVGLALALHAAQQWPRARIATLDARPLDRDVSTDPRTLALSLGSVQLLQRLGAWPEQAATPISQVHVSQAPPGLGWGPEPVVRFSAHEQGQPCLGAVLRYGDLTARLQQAWLSRCDSEPQRLAARFSVAVHQVATHGGRAEVKFQSQARVGAEPAELTEAFDVAVVAEGGVFSQESAQARSASGRRVLQADYHQTAWVGEVNLAQPHGGVAFERFTRHGPAALLPLPGSRAALVWCVGTQADPVAELDESQRLAVLNTVFHEDVGPLLALSPLKKFPLGLLAEATLVQGRVVRIGNAAQTLHPVAGQGLNLGLRDAFGLVRALQEADAGSVDAALSRVQWQRAPDRWALIAATDFLARSFTWALPGAPSLRSAGLAALSVAKPLRSVLARQMMFGWR
jgi:2-octaprenyl-6-methoxyphenol hydroxylase